MSRNVVITIGPIAVHQAEPVFRASVFVGDRGISIPLPPPSLIAEPEQEVDVEGQVVGLDDADVDGLVVHVVDEVGGAQAEVLITGESFHVEGLAVDLTDNCLDLWIEDAEGQQGEHSMVTAVIDPSGQGVTVEQGCD